jgi:hypothetical protein
VFFNLTFPRVEKFNAKRLEQGPHCARCHVHEAALVGGHQQRLHHDRREDVML